MSRPDGAWALEEELGIFPPKYFDLMALKCVIWPSFQYRGNLQVKVKIEGRMETPMSSRHQILYMLPLPSDSCLTREVGFAAE